jgi:putative PIG3 family NAD(P)H quinone oxidoreductase
MKALDYSLQIVDLPDPLPKSGEALVEIAAFGVNRADLLQTAGRYQPPPGASSILGLECSGIIRHLPEAYPGPLAMGDPVCALLTGGGYAELVAVPVGQLLPVPQGYSLSAAAALPEGLCTAWRNLIQVGQLSRDEWVLIHGGAGGVGTFAVQLAAAHGAQIAVTAGTEAKLAHCAELGAGVLINYREQDFSAAIRAHVPDGVAVILDIIGAKYLQQNLNSLAPGGRLLTIGLQGGRRAEVDLALILSRSLHLTGTALRGLAPQLKAELVTELGTQIWPLLAAGTIRPSIHRVDSWTAAAAAHADLAAGDVMGKLVLCPD